MIIVEVLAQVLFWIVMIVGIFVIPVGLPGTFLIAGNALMYGWFTDFSELTGWVIVALFAIAVFAEVLEFVIGAGTAGKFGASRAGMTGAIIGGIAGAILATPLLPILGTLLGAFAGAFAGATAFEFASSRDMDKALRVGVGAFLGSVASKLTKIAAAVAMVVTVGIKVF